MYLHIVLIQEYFMYVKLRILISDIMIFIYLLPVLYAYHKIYFQIHLYLIWKHNFINKSKILRHPIYLRHSFRIWKRSTFVCQWHLNPTCVAASRYETLISKCSADNPYWNTHYLHQSGFNSAADRTFEVKSVKKPKRP